MRLGYRGLSRSTEPEVHPWPTRTILVSTTTKLTATSWFRTRAARRCVPAGCATTTARLLDSLLPFSGNAHVVMEATRNWKVMFDWLEDIVDEVVLAHPLKVKAIVESKNEDRQD